MKNTFFYRRSPVAGCFWSFCKDFVDISYENASFGMLEVLLWLQLIYFLIAVAILVRKISFPDRWGHSKHFTLCSIYRFICDVFTLLKEFSLSKTIQWTDHVKTVNVRQFHKLKSVNQTRCYGDSSRSTRICFFIWFTRSTTTVLLEGKFSTDI